MYPVACCRDSDRDRLWRRVNERCLELAFLAGPLGHNDNNNHHNNLNCEEDRENYVIRLSTSQQANLPIILLTLETVLESHPLEIR
jgi:hypothetical protein